MTATSTDKVVDTKANQVFLVYNGVVTIGDSQFRCRSISTPYNINEIPVSEIVIIADDPDGPSETKTAIRNSDGKDALPTTTNEIYKRMVTKNKGDDVTVMFNMTTPSLEPDNKNKKGLNQEYVTVFTGVLSGWSPIWIGPRFFKMRVWAIHPLGMLDWASSIISDVHGSGFDDYEVPAVWGKNGDLIPYMQGSYTADNVTTDLWKELIKPELIRICKASRFEHVNAAQVAEYLENTEVDLSESPLSWQLSNGLNPIMDIRKTLMKSAPGRESLWDRFIQVAKNYKFSIICRPFGFSMAPTVHAIGGVSETDYTLTTQRFSARQEFNAKCDDNTAGFGTLRGPGGLPSFYDVQGRRLQKEYRLPSEEVVAGVTYRDIPTFLDYTYEPFVTTGETLGLKDQSLHASGYLLEEPSVNVDVSSLNKVYNAVPEEDLEKYVDWCANDEACGSSFAILKGAIDFNIGPGNLVRVELPLYRNIGLVSKDTADEGHAYGFVRGVTLVINMPDKLSGSYVVLSHVRSYEKQMTIELTRHPLYDKRWISAPLIPIEGYTTEPING